MFETKNFDLLASFPQNLFILFFLSIPLNFTITEGFYFTNLISIIVSIIIFLSLSAQSIINNKKDFVILFLISFIIILSLQSINGVKWIYLFFTFFSFSLLFKYYKVSLNFILCLYGFSIVLGTFFLYEFVRFSELGYNISDVSFRSSIDLLGNFNVFGVLLAYAMLVFIHLYFLVKSKYLKIFFILSILYLFVAEISTLSRGGILTFISGILIYYYLSGGLLKNIINSLLIITLVFTFLVAFLDLDFLSIYNRYSFFEDATGSGRTILWSHIFSLIDDPIKILFGSGAGALNIYIPITEDGLFWNEFVSTHNTYLEFLFQFGLFGLTPFLFFLYKTHEKIKLIVNKDNKIILITLFYVSLMNMFFDSYFFAIQTTAIFSLFFSLFWNGDKLE